ncbi:MAG: hypothetical protein ABI374_00515, partial [Ginsengibacter sp.]
MLTTFINSTIYTGSEKISGKALVIEDDKIKAITVNEPAYRSGRQIPQNSKIVDCKNCIIAPGLIDIQIYGAGGYLFSNAPSATALKSMTESLISVGTTGFYV